MWFPWRLCWRNWAAFRMTTTRCSVVPGSTDSFMTSTRLVIHSPAWFCGRALATLRSTARSFSTSRSTVTLTMPSRSFTHHLTTSSIWARAGFRVSWSGLAAALQTNLRSTIFLHCVFFASRPSFKCEENISKCEILGGQIRFLINKIRKNELEFFLI